MSARGKGLLFGWWLGYIGCCSARGEEGRDLGLGAGGVVWYYGHDTFSMVGIGRDTVGTGNLGVRYHWIRKESISFRQRAQVIVYTAP